MSGKSYWGFFHTEGKGLSLHHSGAPRNFVQGVSTNSVEDRGQGERGSGGR